MVTFTEAKRASYLSFVVTLNWINILLALALTGIAVYMRYIVTQISMFSEGYDKELPLLLIAIGGLSIAFNLVSAVIWMVSANPEKRHGVLNFMLLCHFLSISVCVATAAGAVFSFIRTAGVVSVSLTAAMAKYSTYGDIKREIDNLQIKYSCCGNDGLEDWFKLDWHKRTGNGTMDDVPFSCCDPRVLRPCIHEGVRYSDVHIDYNYTISTTLYKKGCTTALRDRLQGSYIRVAGGLLISIFSIQLLTLLLSRCVQTSMSEAVKVGEPTSTTVGFIVPPRSKALEVDEEEEEGEGEEEQVGEDEETAENVNGEENDDDVPDEQLGELVEPEKLPEELPEEIPEEMQRRESARRPSARPPSMAESERRESRRPSAYPPPPLLQPSMAESERRESRRPSAYPPPPLLQSSMAESERRESRRPSAYPPPPLLQTSVAESQRRESRRLSTYPPERFPSLPPSLPLQRSRTPSPPPSPPPPPDRRRPTMRPGVPQTVQPAPLIPPSNAWGQTPQPVLPPQGVPLDPAWQAYYNYYRQPPLIPPFPPQSHPEFPRFDDQNVGYSPLEKKHGNIANFPDWPTPAQHPLEQRYLHDMSPGRRDPFDMSPGRRDPHDMSPGWRYPHDMSPGWRDPFDMSPGLRDPHDMPPGRTDPYDMSPGRRDPYDMSPGRRDPYDMSPGRRDPFDMSPGWRYPHDMSPGWRYPHDMPPGRRDPYDMSPGQRDPFDIPTDRRDRRHVVDDVIYFDDEDDLQELLRQYVDSEDLISYSDDVDDTASWHRRRSSSSDFDDRYLRFARGGSRPGPGKYSSKVPKSRRYRTIR